MKMAPTSTENRRFTARYPFSCLVVRQRRMKSSKKVAAKLFILQKAENHFLTSLSGPSPVNCLSECGSLQGPLSDQACDGVPRYFSGIFLSGSDRTIR
jgi:hypothetical protein